MRTVTPRRTPRTEISVMMERKVRFGFRYRSARKKLNGRLKARNGCRKVGRSPNVKKSDTRPHRVCEIATPMRALNCLSCRPDRINREIACYEKRGILRGYSVDASAR